MKVANSYESVLRGVSQQVPQERADGQHADQINMIADPIEGLSRRHGSVWLGEKDMVGLVPAQWVAYLSDASNWVSYDFDKDGKEYIILYRKGARPASANPLPLFMVYNKTDKAFLNYSETGLSAVAAAGIAALTSVGKYLFFTGNGVNVTGTSTEVWNTAANLKKAVVWVRGGAYSRTFKITVRRQSGSVSGVTYTTPAASYPTALDTSDIPYAAADYVKQVNDRVNAYNSAVTAWVGTAAAAIQPAAIAAQLQAGLAAYHTTTLVGSHICFSDVTDVKSIDVDDGGDGSLMRAVADEVESADKTSVVHSVGKVVKVRGKSSSDSYYLKAVPRDSSVSSGYTEVTWSEGAGVINTLTGGLCSAIIVGSTIYAASDAAGLATLTAGPHPEPVASRAGDLDSAPPPAFINGPVTYLGTFQNRLLVGSGGALAVSETENYLNFFRTTALTLPASDPFQMLPQGSEDDELVSGALYDQDLVVFGKRRQYVLSGQAALTPASANMPVMASYEGVVDAAPVAAGGLIFYAKRGPTHSNVFQIQPGQNTNSPEAFPVSSQVSAYIAGGITEMTSLTGSPSTLAIRASGAQSSLYMFTYYDRQDGRKLDSWGRWDVNPELGPSLGMSVTKDGLVVVTLRVSSNGKVYSVADLFPLTAGVSSGPYLDSRREVSLVSGGLGSVLTTSSDQWAAAFDSRSTRHLIGAPLSGLAAIQSTYPGELGLVVGAVNDASVELTNPVMRDNKGKAILSGRLTIIKKLIAFRNSTGFSWSLSYKGQAPTIGSFSGRVIGASNNLVGLEPISTGQRPIPVGREVRDYSLTIKARKWYPLTITAIEWVGQFFNRVQRF